ncbi:methyltransferase domain-containing protein [Candidatus Poribacteria bacterium]|nr:methyltransferase domain-containing protein [Candidatus Poribacteria bacterium]
MNIKSTDLVLEIGSGDNPKTRSDVLCDMLPDDDTQRGGVITLDRPFVAADGQYLPFADKSFDYIICCHVLEHAEDPEMFISELVRVGKRGYIESPTEVGERLYGWPYHKWLINLDSSGKIILKRKLRESDFGQVFHYLFSNDRNYARFHRRNHRLFLIQYEWVDEIDYEISDDYYTDLKDQFTLRELANPSESYSLSQRIKNILPKWLVKKLKSSITRTHGRHKVTLDDIIHLIVCPVCKGSLEWIYNDNSGECISVLCLECDRNYKVRNGIPFLMP